MMPYPADLRRLCESSSNSSSTPRTRTMGMAATAAMAVDEDDLISPSLGVSAVKEDHR